MNKIEYYVEKALWQSRYMIFIAVVAAIVSAFVMIMIGTYDVCMIFKDFMHVFGDAEAFEHFHHEALSGVVSSLDSYLIATVLLIFGIGLYELFISKIDFAENDVRSSKILVIHTLDELKEKVAKVIIMVLIVTFFEYAIAYDFQDIKSLLYLSIGILLISVSVYLMHFSHGSGEE